MSLIVWFEAIGNFIASLLQGPKEVNSRKEFAAWHGLTQVKANLFITEGDGWLYYNLSVNGYVGGQSVVQWQSRVATEHAFVRGFGPEADAKIVAGVRNDLLSLARQMRKDIRFCKPTQNLGAACETISHDEPHAKREPFSLTQLT